MLRPADEKIINPSFIFLQHLDDLGRIHLAVRVVINHDDRSKAACAETADPLERESPVAGGCAYFNLEAGLYFIDDLLYSLDITRRTKAGADQVPSSRLH